MVNPDWTGIPPRWLPVAATPHCHQVATQVTLVQALGLGLGAGVSLTSVTLTEPSGPLHGVGEICLRAQCQEFWVAVLKLSWTCWVTLGQCISLSEPCFLPHIRTAGRPPLAAMSSILLASPRLHYFDHSFIGCPSCAVDRINNNNSDRGSNSKSPLIMTAYSTAGLVLSI